MDRRRYLAAVSGVVATGFAGCLGDDDAPADEEESEADGEENGADDEAAGPVGEWSDGNVEFALPPFQDAEELQAQYADTFEWLEEGFEGVDAVEGVPTTSYSAVVESVVQGHTELANFSPIIYVLAADEGIHPLAINWSHGRDSYRSYVATRADSDVETLNDLEGKTVAMVDPLSTSGGLFPRYVLDQAGLDAGDVGTEPGDFDIEWSAGHDASLRALEEGHVDAAAYGDFQHPDGDEIVKLAESDEIPFDPIVAKPDTPEEVRESIAERLHETPDERLEDHRVDRYGPVDDATYDPVRDVAEAMGIEVSDLEEEE